VKKKDEEDKISNAQINKTCQILWTLCTPKVITPYYRIGIRETFIRACFAYVSSQYVCKSFFRAHKMTAMLLQDRERVRVLSRCVFVGCRSLKTPAAVSCLKRSFTTKLFDNGQS
jgi:hypothetical protein